MADVKPNADSVASIFESMSYGPAPEADNVVKAWLDDHKHAFGHFINGAWVKPDGRKTYESKNPSTGDVLATTIRGEKEDVDLAVSSARAAHQKWSQLSPHARARHMYSIARHVQKHARLISILESLDNGKTIRESRDIDIPIVIRHLYHYAGWAQLVDTEMAGWKSVGVVGAIVPWNFPLMLMLWKVCPALAMGNTVVLKPASYTSLTALLFAELCAEAGLPPGVLNVVTGSGEFGSLLAGHDGIDKVAFTGSTPVGKTLRRLTAGSGKKLSLELGGKSPFIVFDTCDVDSAVEGVVNAIWFNQGQVCSAGSKLLIQETIFERFVGKLKERLTHFKVGDSMDKTADMGPLVDASQLQTVTDYVLSAEAEGAQVYQAPFNKPARGFYYPPTLITGVQTVSKVVQEEIFGPVAVALPFRTAKESIALANNTCYGLAASVWTENVSLALEVALSVKAGTVWINCHNLFDAAAGFGGYKESGYGRDGGKEGLYEYARPSWEERPEVKAAALDYAKFGSTLPHRPTYENLVERSETVGSAGPAAMPPVDHTYKLHYGGKQQRPDAPYSRAIRAAATGEVLSHVGDSSRKDVRNAVAAAHEAFPGWGKRAAHNRAQVVYYMAENLELRRREFADRLRLMTGCSPDAALAEVDESIQRLFYWAAYCDKYGGTVQETTLYGCTVKVHEPVGVIGIACPDEMPLLAFVSLLAPAVVRANCVVVVPSEKHPLLALDMYQIFDTSDVPGGVINILTGDRDHITRFLTEHQDVQAMWYFGSQQGSQFVEHSSADNVKRTWVNYGLPRDWKSAEQGQGEEFLHQSVQCKNIWIPMGDIFAN